MYELIPFSPPSTLEEALAVSEERRGLGWHIATLQLAAALMLDERSAKKDRELGKEIFIQLADPTIERLRVAGRWTVWTEVQIWEQADRGEVPQAQGYKNITEWVQARGEAGMWYDSHLPQLDGQTIRAYLRVFRLYGLEWKLPIEELGNIPFGKLRDGSAFARSVETDEREEFLRIMREFPRSEVIHEFLRSKGQNPGPREENRLTKKGFFLDWDTGFLWLNMPTSSGGMEIGIIGRFRDDFSAQVQIMVRHLHGEGIQVEEVGSETLEDALLSFCKAAGIRHD